MSKTGDYAKMTAAQKRKAKERHARWRAKNKEHLREYHAKRRNLMRDLYNAYHRAYYAKNRRTIRGRQIPYQKEYRRRKREILNLKQRQRYWADPRKYRKKIQKWRAQNKEWLRRYKAESRALAKQMPGLTVDMIKQLRRKKK